MKCPVCKDDLLQHETLESNVPAYKCGRCNGIWLSSTEYLAWLQLHNQTLPDKACVDIPVPVWDTQELKLCADCGRILSRYKVLPNTKFVLDHCGHCNGVWLDKGEWDILIARNLLGKINQFFTRAWQTSLQEEEAKAELDKLYTVKFGIADYARAKEIWNWLRDHPQRAMLLAYLQAENPFKV